MTSLTPPELRTIYETIHRTEYVRRNGIKELRDLFTENLRLIISPNNFCAGSCLHCVADSTPSGETMPYDRFTRIDPRFFEIFSVADFGRRGNPLLYRSHGKDIVDIMEFLNKHGIAKFTLALTLQNHSIPAIKRLEEIVASKNVDIETMVTYHHYYEDLDTAKLAQDFNSTLKNYMEFSKRIIISLLGDLYSQTKPTKAEEVQKAFQDDWGKVFRDIELAPFDDKVTYNARFESKEAQIYIPPIDTRVYPLGKFKKYLTQRGSLQEYETQFEQALGDYVCPDLVKWPGIIIEPDGSLNLCASFEAVPCPKAVVTNIFTKSYSQVQEELQQFHQRETRWFIDNLPEIIAGTVSTCKLKNNCYQK